MLFGSSGHLNCSFVPTVGHLPHFHALASARGEMDTARNDDALSYLHVVVRVNPAKVAGTGF